MIIQLFLNSRKPNLPFFLYICLSFLQESEIFFAQENEISKIYQRHKKGALQEMQYVCQCRTRKNKQHSAKAGLNSMNNNDMTTFRFLHFSFNIVHFKKCVLFSNYAISRLYVSRNLESIVSLTRVIIPSFTLYFCFLLLIICVQTRLKFKVLS